MTISVGPAAEPSAPRTPNCTAADSGTVDRAGLVHAWRDAERTDGVGDGNDYYLCVRCGCVDSD